MIAVPTTRRSRYVAHATYVGIVAMSVLAGYMLWTADPKLPHDEAARSAAKLAQRDAVSKPLDLGAGAPGIMFAT